MKVGIALGGGGARGFAHIGILRVLESAHIPIDFIAGTSAGAIVGSLYAAGKSPDEIQAIARRLRLRHWMERDHSGMGLFSTNGLRRILESEMGKDQRIQDLPRRFCAVAVDLDSHCETVFDAGSVVEAVCASATFPGLFAPTMIEGRSFIDGGALNPVPFDIVRQRGVDIVLAVDLGADEPLFTGGNLNNRRDAWFFQLLITAEQLKIFRVVARAIGIMTRQLRIAKLKHAPPDLMIQPDAQNIGLMDFDLVDMTVAAGETAARAALPQIENLVRPAFAMRWQFNWRKFMRRWRKTLTINAR